MTAGIDGGMTGSSPKRPHWKWSLCDSEKSESRGYIYTELDVLKLKIGKQRRRLLL